MGIRKRFSFLLFKKPRFKVPKFRLPRFNLKWILVITLVVVLIGGGVGVYLNYDTISPEEAVNTAINKTLNADTYRYKAISKKVVDNEEELLSEIVGEKSNGNVHFSGKLHVVNSDFEIYQVDNKFYRKDVFSKDWLIVDEVNMKATEKLIQEINPLGAFTFTGPIDAQYIGKEKINGRKFKKYEVKAQTENKYLEVLWKDFTYTIWVDKSGTLAKAEINAVNKQHGNYRLIMSVDFSDYNKELVIKPPI